MYRAAKGVVVYVVASLVWIQTRAGWRIAIEVHQEDTSNFFDFQAQKVGGNRNEIRDFDVRHSTVLCDGALPQ